MTSPSTIIQMKNNQLIVPDHVSIPCIPGDGIGPEVFSGMTAVVDAALKKVFHKTRSFIWMEVPAGEKSFNQTGKWLPQETLDAFEKYKVGIKGPMTTPVGGGIRSLNVAIRKELDLYVCLRPVRYFRGVSAPVRRPELIDVAIFRENTEDVYSGIELQSDSPEASSLLQWMEEKLPSEYKKIRFTRSVGLGIKPISKEGSSRLVRAAIEYALKNNKPSVTLVHKGNIMKFTEGAFRQWGYDVAEREYKGSVYTALQFARTLKSNGIETARAEKASALENGMIWMNDVIADAAFQNLLLYPQDFHVIATPNLNGDYISDALAAQVGGIGISPGANINYQTGIAVFEATHGSAPDIAGKNMANPSSLILSAILLLEYIGWNEAADMITKGLEKTISEGQMTRDLAQFVDGSTTLGTDEFSQAIINNF